MNDDSDFELLLAYLSDELDNDEVAAVIERLQREPALAQRLVELASEEGKIVEWAGSATRSAMRERAATCIVPQRPPTSLLRLAAVVWGTALVLILGVALWFYLQNDPIGGQVAQQPEPVLDLRLAKLTDCRWADNTPAMAEGDELRFGTELKLLEGVAEIEYPSGVRVTLQGSSTFTAVSAQRGLLTVGRLSATVPRAAVGYAIETPSLDVIDLGTQFGVCVAEDGSTEVHVFQGEVETVTRGEEESPAVRQTLSTAQAARFNLAGHFDGWLPPDCEKFESVEQRTPGVVSTDGGTRWLAKPPPSVEEGQLQSANDMFLFLERENVVLPRDIAITTEQRRGTQAHFGVEQATLPAGTRVDSYLLHFDPGASEESRRGGVRFARPVLGLIARGDQLRATDDLFAAPGTRYVFQHPAESGLDDAQGDEYPDVVQYKDSDGQVYVLKSHRGSIDQVRILIPSEEP